MRVELQADDYEPQFDYEWTLRDCRDEYGIGVRWELHVTRWKGSRLFRRLRRDETSGTEWGPIAGEEHRNEPKFDWENRWWAATLFGVEIHLVKIWEG